ncbi:MAG: hypothetical protein WEB30_07050 [Cyclobacteriaceae bacterium]
MALINKQKYDPVQVQKLADIIRIYHEKGQPIDYEIAVDGLKVVRRTSDPDMFYLFENFVTADTKAVEIIFYTGTSNVNERRLFSFVDDVEERGLSGFEVQAQVKEQLGEQKKELLKELHYDQLVKENQGLKDDVAELEKEVEQLEKEKQVLLDSQSPLKGFLGEVGSSLVESFIRRNPNVIKGIPGGEALAGLMNAEAKPDESKAENTEVSFQPKGKTQSLSEEDQAAITFVNQLKSQFSKDEFDKILLILQTLADDKSKIDLILNHVNIKQV